MKKKKKKLVKYQGTKNSIVNRASDMLKTVISNAPRPTIPGTMSDTGIPMPMPKTKGSSDSIKTSPMRGPNWNPNIKTDYIKMIKDGVKKLKHGGSCGPAQWTRNGKGSRRAL